MSKLDIYRMITDNMIIKIEEGIKAGSWEYPWLNSSCNGLPVNGTTGKHYNGINIPLLMMAGMPSANWASYKQWGAKGRHVRKGQKGSQIVFFKVLEKVKKDGSKDKIPLLRYSTVFNESQLDDYEAPEELTRPENERLPEVDQYIVNTGAVINFDETARAFYRPSTDEIGMVPLEGMKGSNYYYSTLFHELTHWTGHKDRENRTEIKGMSYAYEELIAELGACFQCAKHHIKPEANDNSARYLKSWLEQMKGDSKFLFKASASAQKAVDYMDSKQPKARVEKVS